ncbi:MAG TPA: hypothetical protein PKZ07_18650, partial [Sedimentisphaerales bacterium]|nr:hypothetical protein [Sedimentisphaerales bacterium]
YTEYTAPDNASIAAIKSQTDKLNFVGSDVKATLDGETVTVSVNNDKTGYSLTADYDRAKTALSVSEYTAPDNAGIAAIKTKTDKLTFDASNYVYAVATADVDEQAIADAIVEAIQDQNLVQVVVQPLVANVQRTDGDGGVIGTYTGRRFIASWTIEDTDLTGHDLRLILYTQSAPATTVVEYDSEISVAYDAGTGNSVVSLAGAVDSTPDAGQYCYVLHDATADIVLLAGKAIVRPAPEAGT